MFERFTERARQVIVLAEDEARAVKHSYIGTEHLLLGLLREEEGLASRALENSGVSIEKVRERVNVIVGPGDVVAAGKIPFTPRAKKVLELSLREALSLGHNYVGTEHVLLGLVRENEGVAARILLDLGVTADKIRNEIINMLAGPGRTAVDVTVESVMKSVNPETATWIREAIRGRKEEKTTLNLTATTILRAEQQECANKVGELEARRRAYESKLEQIEGELETARKQLVDLNDVLVGAE